ncbi:MAG: NUDIX hydrolase [Nitrospira sp.]|nr:MAG: NUDIX hydrolase [Nitrospira sp.]
MTRNIYTGKVVTLNVDTVELPNGVTIDGKLSPGEDPLHCAARELEEEVGYRAASFELLSSIFTAPGFADEVIHVYKATGLIQGRQQLDHDEVLEIVEMPLTAAIERIADGTIRDGKTIVGLQAVYIRGLKTT